MLKATLPFLAILVCLFQLHAQKTDSVPQKGFSIKDSLISLYHKEEGYFFVKSINTNLKDSLYNLNCYSGKQLLVMAVFDKQPIKDEGYLYVYQKTRKKTIRQSFAFEAHHLVGKLDVYISSVKVFYPTEANAENCYSKVMMKDKELPSNKYYFLLFVK